MLREARDSFLSEMELQLKCNLKRFWLTLKLESKHRGIPEVISMATDPSGEPADVGSRIQASSPAEIVELFNRYFVSVFTSDPVTCNSADEEYAGPNVDLTLSDLTPTVTQVLDVLAKLDASKATGLDEIPARILETVYDIAPSLCEVFKKSLRLGSLPMAWKLANVVPVFKRENKEYVENYKPILLLCLVSKKMEHCVFNSIKYHVYSLIDSSQHGFITGRSCVTQLVEVLDYIGSQLHNGGQVDVIYLDMSKACDKVSHRKLLRKLRDYRFGGKLLDWLESYFHDQMQRVMTLGVNSQDLPVTSGVLQGSILGPCYFSYTRILSLVL